MRISYLMLILTFTLGVAVAYSQAESPQDNVVIKVISQRTDYLAQSPIFFRVGLFNVGNVPIELEIPENFPQGISVIPSFPEQGRGIKRLNNQEIRDGDPRAEKTLPIYQKIKVPPKSALIWEFSARFIFTEPGQYRLDSTLPEVRLTHGRQPAILAKGQLEFVVVKESDTLKDGIEAGVDLVEPAEGKSGGFKWELNPPKRAKMPVPYFQFGNCRFVIRDAKDKIVHDLMWDLPKGKSPSAEYWKNSIEWVVPMDSATFGLSGNVFPKRGLYTVEAQYRAYISSTGKQATQGRVRLIDEFGGGLFVTSSELEERGEKPWQAVKPQEVQKLDPKDFVSDRGRWISLTKKFQVEATDKTWQKWSR